MLPLMPRVKQYLQEVLGVPVTGNRAWKGEGGLPYFLRDAFEFRQLDILGKTVVLALDRHPGQSSLKEIGASLDKVRAVAGHPAVYVTESMASYERKRLIERKVPFIVPGNQLYVPELGVDLREYFRRRPGPAQAPLSPAAQAMLVSALLRPSWEPEWHPSEAATRLGYTPMTLSRAVREIVATGLAQARKAGRSQVLVMMHSPQETWERAGPVLRTPVQRVTWTSTPVAAGSSRRLAGLSALAHRSMLTAPRSPVYAVSRSVWNTLKAKVVELPAAMPGADEWQLWSYSTTLEADSDTVDPLSLILSLRGSPDERVQGALDALKAQLPW